MFPHFDQFFIVAENTHLLAVIADQVINDPDRDKALAVAQRYNSWNNQQTVMEDPVAQRRIECYFDVLLGVLRHILYHGSSVRAGKTLFLPHETMVVVTGWIMTELLQGDTSSIKWLEQLELQGLSAFTVQ